MLRGVKIGFVDDHELFLTAICDSLKSFSDDFSVQGFVSGLDFLKTVEQGNDFDIFIIDMAMKEINGLALIDVMRQKNIKQPIILLTGIENALSGDDPLHYGAQMLLPKTTSIEQLASAICDLTSASSNIAKTSSAVRSSGASLLTERQIEILSLAGKGRSASEIAHDLSISTNTVKHHFKAAYAALDVKNLAACVTRLRELGYM